MPRGVQCLDLQHPPLEVAFTVAVGMTQPYVPRHGDFVMILMIDMISVSTMAFLVLILLRMQMPRTFRACKFCSKARQVCRECRTCKTLANTVVLAFRSRVGAPAAVQVSTRSMQRYPARLFERTCPAVPLRSIKTIAR